MVYCHETLNIFWDLMASKSVSWWQPINSVFLIKMFRNLFSTIVAVPWEWIYIVHHFYLRIPRGGVRIYGGYSVHHFLLRISNGRVRVHVGHIFQLTETVVRCVLISYTVNHLWLWLTRWVFRVVVVYFMSLYKQRNNGDFNAELLHEIISFSYDLNT